MGLENPSNYSVEGAFGYNESLTGMSRKLIIGLDFKNCYNSIIRMLPS